MDISINTLEKLYSALEKLRLPNGLYKASDGSFYQNYSWHRDNCNAVIDFLETNPEKYQQTYQTTLDLLKFFEKKYKKFSAFIKDPSDKSQHKFLHARVSVRDMDEIHECWSNLQFDLACILFWISKGEQKGIKIIRDESDREIIQLFINFLDAWQVDITPNASYWEEDCMKRSSSLGICLASLIEIEKIGFNIPNQLIERCREEFERMLPREADNRICDLAQLSLIYPYNIVNDIQRDYILENVKKYLLRNYGCIRYEGDYYYNCNHMSNNLYGGEAHWSFGWFYLSNVYSEMGDLENAKYYLQKGLSLSNEDGSIPELFFANNGKPNENKNLAWSVSLAIIATRRILEGEKYAS